STLRAILSEAECRLQSPPAHPFVRNLLSQDLGGLAASLRGLAGTKHPLVEDAKRSLLFSAVGGSGGLSSDSSASSALASAVGQTRRAVVLLVARAHEELLTKGSDLHDLELLRRRQCQLADIADSVYTALSIHSRVVPPTNSDLAKGNALAALAGDYLLASASLGLAELDRPPVVKLISEAICDIVAGRFSLIANAAGTENSPSSNKLPDMSAWLDYVRLTSASLLSKSIRSALILATDNANYNYHQCATSSAEDQSIEQFSESFAILQHAYKEKVEHSSIAGASCLLERISTPAEINDLLNSNADQCLSTIDSWPAGGYCTHYLRQIVRALLVEQRV
uniref:Conserved oligomeric Golgi complex subunit 5 n=2 Tax=Macrostomum lignano TaxID=282301 RepID=A0A1I8ICD2_9PLAT